MGEKGGEKWEPNKPFYSSSIIVSIVLFLGLVVVMFKFKCWQSRTRSMKPSRRRGKMLNVLRKQTLSSLFIPNDQ